MSGVLFITGGAGLIGREVLSHFVARTDWRIYVLVHDRGRGCDARAFLGTILGRPSTLQETARLGIVHGDITRADLGLSPAVRERLTAEVTGVLHCAACTRFDLPLDEARRTNVRGTRTVLELARRCRRLTRFGFLSTVYVAGKSIGTILERRGGDAAGFVNTYEQTKDEAERLVDAAGRTIPAAIYRLSTVVGDSRTGRVGHLTAPHHALRVMYLGLASMIPGTPECRVDLIPSDHAAETLFELFTTRFAPGQIFHLAAGKDRSYTLADIVERSYAYLGEADAAWRARRYPRPVLVSARAFDLFLQSVERTGNPLFAGVTQAVRHFALQLLYPKEFDRSRLLAVLPEYDQRLPHIDAYYGKVVDYCLRSQWGKDDSRGRLVPARGGWSLSDGRP